MPFVLRLKRRAWGMHGTVPAVAGGGAADVRGQTDLSMELQLQSAPIFRRLRWLQ